jgi:general secretion pathway protein K
VSPPRARARRRGDERGFALIAVLLVMAIVGALGAEFAYSMRLEASAVRAYRHAVEGGLLVEAALAQAAREIVNPTAVYAALDDKGVLTFHTRDRLPVPHLNRTEVALGGGQFTYRLTDEEARVNVNTAAPDRLDRLLQALGIDKRERDVVVDSIQDWRDPNEEHRLNGAESDDHYLKLAVPHRSRNGNLESIGELLQIRGVTRELFRGADRRPGLAEMVTVKTPGQVNINTAGPLVFRTLGLSDAEISDILQGRRDHPYTAVPGRFAGRGLTVTSRTFRVDAEGLVDGRVRARVTAVVQRRGDPSRPTLAVLEWSAGS